MIIETHDLSRSFGKFLAVNQVNLQVHQGDVYGFLGRNGAGKTTVIRMLMGIIQSSKGTISLFDQTTKKISAQQKQKIGYVPQEQNFYPWMTAKQLAKFVGALYSAWDQTEFLRLLDIFDVALDRKIADLSGGTQVKLALAVALSHHSELLLLDEPTAGLDPIARREFLDIISVYAKDKTVFFSSHLVHEIEEVANKIGIINNGRLCFQGDRKILTESVRQLTLSEPIAHLSEQLDERIKIIREDKTVITLKAEAQVWNDFSTDLGELNSLSLEEIFILLATGMECEA